MCYKWHTCMCMCSLVQEAHASKPQGQRTLFKQFENILAFMHLQCAPLLQEHLLTSPHLTFTPHELASKALTTVLLHQLPSVTWSTSVCVCVCDLVAWHVSQRVRSVPHWQRSMSIAAT